MSAETAAERAEHVLPFQRRFELTYDAGVYVGPTVYGFFFGAAFPHVVAFALSRWLVDKSASIYFLDGPEAPLFSSLGYGLLFAIGTIVLRAYQQGTVEIVIDATGIREKESGKTRLFIPWRDARGFHAAVRKRKRNQGETLATWVRFASPSGEQIAMTDADEGLGMPSYARRTVARVMLSGLERVVSELAPLDPKELDPRKLLYDGPRGIRIAEVLALGVILFVFNGLFETYGFRPEGRGFGAVPVLDAVLASAVVGAACVVRLVVPFRHYRAVVARRALLAKKPSPSAGAYREAAPREEEETSAEALAAESTRTLVRLVLRVATLVLLASAPLLALGRVRGH